MDNNLFIKEINECCEECQIKNIILPVSRSVYNNTIRYSVKIFNGLIIYYSIYQTYLAAKERLEDVRYQDSGK